jgi:hypothetical protein
MRIVRIGRHTSHLEAILMKPFLGAALAILFVATTAGPTRADDKDPSAILDKAIKAVGGEEKLKKTDGMTWKSKGTLIINGDSNPFTVETTVVGLDQYRATIDGEFGGNPVKGVVVYSGNKGWRKFGDDPMEMEEGDLANEKRRMSLEIIPIKLVVLKEKGYKLEAADEQKVGDKPAAGIKVTRPDGKDFTIYFDKESGLPVRTVAKVVGFGNEEYTQETTLKDFKDFDGIKMATKSETKRNGEDFIKSDNTEFKVLEKVDAKTFSEPS